METEPDYENMTDREWSKRADRHARHALTVVGTMQSDWNAIVSDNRFLQSRCNTLEIELRDLRETVELLSGIILNG
jgi:hypothetical protein